MKRKTCYALFSITFITVFFSLILPLQAVNDSCNYDLEFVYGCAIDDQDNYIALTNNSDSTSFSNFANEYFQNLSEYGINENGSCGYIAIGMWLMYYDTYWNDSIVDDTFVNSGVYVQDTVNYSLRSPGINDPRLSSNSPYLSDFNSYLNYMINDQSSTNLHAYLVKLGYELGYVNGSDLALSRECTYSILTNYLANHSLFDNFSFIFHNITNNPAQIYPGTNYTYSENARKNVITYVKLGIPVITFIRSDNNSGHVVIAYDYDDDSDILYCHFAPKLGYNYHQNVFSYGYKYITGYIAGTPKNFDHVHSNNYNNLTNAQQTVCSCQLSSHEHRYNYDSPTETKHRRYCYCGDSSYQAHIFSGSSGRFVFCEKCNYRKLNDGGIIDIPNPFSTTEILEDIENIKESIHNTQNIITI